MKLNVRDKCGDYSHIRGMLLQQFKLTVEIRELFSCKKKPEKRRGRIIILKSAYFEGWLNELKIDSFDGLKKFDDCRSNEKEMLQSVKIIV
ncbi:hypothetical protein TNCV_2508291 [Trichonephila clavipes]|nr:hypothetical protein TNCV_2508291 [Trichonephila clavipes]